MFSVLLSVYYKEKEEYVKECFESLLSQTVLATEWVIVEDGPLTVDLYTVLDDYERMYPNLIKRVKLSVNSGLGVALAEGIKACTYEIVARMDTDDIARADRFEKQLEAFRNDEGLDICSSYISEFENTKDEEVAIRKVPILDGDIKKYQKKRDAFNHMAVMYKKAAVMEAGNYISCPLMEDTYLWVRMIQNNVKCLNIPECLVYARIGQNMYERRGGLSYFFKYRKARQTILKTGYISYFDYLSTVLVQLTVALIPNKVRGWIYKNILHRG